MSTVHRIGIFDPAFIKQGHFDAYNRYIAQLLDNPAYQVIFLDLHGDMQELYERTLTLGRAPEFCRLIPDNRPARYERFGMRINAILRRLAKWKTAYRVIAEQDLDLVLITSESYDPFMYLFRPRFTYGLFVLNARLHIYRPIGKQSFKNKMLFGFYARKYKNLAKGAAFLISGSEPSMLPELEMKLGLGKLPWLPNLPIGHVTPNEGPFEYDIITIGTISRTKSHLLALEAFEERSLPWKYLVAGLPRDSVGRTVEEKTHQLEKKEGLAVSGNFGYIGEIEYTRLMRSARFSLFPYDFTRGNISSQVMHDGFQQGLPIIAPSIEPFVWYVEKYGIGLIYKEGDKESLARTLEEAMRRGPESFREGFKRLEKDHSIERIQKDFLAILDTALAKLS